jgi:hypothetical protein
MVAQAAVALVVLQILLQQQVEVQRKATRAALLDTVTLVEMVAELVIYQAVAVVVLVLLVQTLLMTRWQAEMVEVD